MLSERTQRDSRTIERAARHVEYEIRALGAALRKLESDPSSDAALVGFYIHSRNLIDFLYPEKARRDDVLAADFLPRGQDWSPPLPDVLGAVRKPINKLVAHLTYERTSELAEAASRYLAEHRADVWRAISQSLGAWYEHLPEHLAACVPAAKSDEG